MAHEPVIIEDGTIVSGANSWVTRAEFIAYAETIGVTIPDNTTSDQHLVKAQEFISQHDANIDGTRVDRDQSTAFPRIGLMINGFSYLSTEIPAVLKKCQIEFAIDDHLGFDLWNPSANPALIKRRSRVEGAVEVEYAVGEATGQSAMRTSRGQALLSMLLKTSSGGLPRIILERG
jgi:hypothetical protein